jgi:hypothetical protein
MIRFLLRFIGVFVLAAAFVALLYDGTKTIAGSEVYLTSLQEIWIGLHPGSLQWLQASAERLAPAWVWNPALVTVLTAPASLVLAIIGALLMLLGRKKKPLIGYAR